MHFYVDMFTGLINMIIPVELKIVGWPYCSDFLNIVSNIVSLYDSTY